MDSHAREQAFGQYLLDHALLSEALLRQAQDVTADTRDPLVRSLAKLGFMPEVRLADALSEFLEFPRASQPLTLSEDLSGLSVEFLKFHGIAPLSMTEEEITVAVSNPLDDAGLRGVEFATTRRAKPLIGTFSDIDSAFALRSGDSADTSMLDAADSDGSIEALRDLASDAPAIRLVQRLITMAVDRKASDIHIEPVETAVKVRFRLDGVLQDIESFSSSYASPIVSRIKVMARLNIAERRLPQDGRLNITVNGKGIDFRVATSPTLHSGRILLNLA